MTHISSDKRSQTSAELIGDAMQRLLCRKAFDKITISDIQRESSVGRSTFYRLFDNTVDVLSYLCNNILNTIYTHYPKSHEGMREAMIYFTNIWLTHEPLLQAIISNGHFEVLYEMFFNNMSETKEFLLENLEIDETQKDYLLSIMSTSMVGGLTAWLKHEKKKTLRKSLKM